MLRYPKLSRTRVADLQQQKLPRADCDSIGLGIGAKTEEAQTALPTVIQILNEYLAHFVRPLDPTVPCVNCGRPQEGPQGCFKANTLRIESSDHYLKGRCGRCKYPGRWVHVVMLPGGDLLKFERTLQYHPSELTQMLK